MAKTVETAREARTTDFNISESVQREVDMGEVRVGGSAGRDGGWLIERVYWEWHSHCIVGYQYI
jgi:hypothetical protein